MPRNATFASQYSFKLFAKLDAATSFLAVSWQTRLGVSESEAVDTCDIRSVILVFTGMSPIVEATWKDASMGIIFPSPPWGVRLSSTSAVFSSAFATSSGFSCPRLSAWRRPVATTRYVNTTAERKANILNGPTGFAVVQQTVWDDKRLHSSIFMNTCPVQVSSLPMLSALLRQQKLSHFLRKNHVLVCSFCSFCELLTGHTGSRTNVDRHDRDTSWKIIFGATWSNMAQQCARTICNYAVATQDGSFQRGLWKGFMDNHPVSSCHIQRHWKASSCITSRWNVWCCSSSIRCKLRWWNVLWHELCGCVPQNFNQTDILHQLAHEVESSWGCVANHHELHTRNTLHFHSVQRLHGPQCQFQRLAEEIRIGIQMQSEYEITLKYIEIHATQKFNKVVRERTSLQQDTQGPTKRSSSSKQCRYREALQDTWWLAGGKSKPSGHRSCSQMECFESDQHGSIHQSPLSHQQKHQWKGWRVCWPSPQTSQNK